MVTKTIPSKPKPEAKEVDFSNEDTTLTPEQEKAAREKAKSLTKKWDRKMQQNGPFWVNNELQATARRDLQRQTIPKA